jgi:hypothetical protein
MRQTFNSKSSKNAAIGFGLVALGAGLSIAGIAVLAPVCYTWSRTLAEQAYRRGKQNMLVGIDEASAKLREVADKVQGPLGEAAHVVRHTTAVAAGAVEAAAHYVRERVE